MKKLISLLAVALVTVSGLGSARAQDITVSDPVWMLPEPAPDEMPHGKGRLRPDYPDELRKTSEIGYALVTRYLDPKGQSLSVHTEATHMPFQRAVEEALRDWTLTPAKRAGQGVNAKVWVAAIFNPKSSSAKGPDATPRLVAITPVFTPTRPTPSPQSTVVPMKFSLDATGAIMDAVPQVEVDPKALPALQAAVKSWQFAPARKDGQPVAAEIVVGVVCMRPDKPGRANVIPPKAITRVPPEYPYAMRRYALHGQVVLSFEVDAEGKVQNAVVSSSDNPVFDKPALEALRQWKFQPGTRDGRPEKTRMQLPIIFELNGPAENAFQITNASDQSKLPPDLRYDTPPKIRNVNIPVYPYEQRRNGVSGKAKVTMLIDPRGRVSDVKILSADQPEFGLALAAAVQGFRFDPALKNGKPVPHLLGFEQSFSDQDFRDGDIDSLLRLEKKHPEKIVGAAKLDAPLKPISRQPIPFPVTVGPEVSEGDAVVECLVDEEGHARLPRIISASAPAFGYAAVQSANHWWFEPPKSGGKSVVVRVQIPFKFQIKEPKARDPAATNNRKPDAAADTTAAAAQ